MMAFNFSCGIQRAVKSGQDIYILAARVANDLVILLAHGASHIINKSVKSLSITWYQQNTKLRYTSQQLPSNLTRRAELKNLFQSNKE